MIVTPGAQEVEGREALLVDHDHLTVDEAGPHRQARDSLTDLRKAISEIVSVPREQPNGCFPTSFRSPRTASGSSGSCRGGAAIPDIMSCSSARPALATRSCFFVWC